MNKSLLLSLTAALAVDFAAGMYFADWRVAMPLGLALYAAFRIPIPRSWKFEIGEKP
jgi:hypothetical protein